MPKISLDTGSNVGSQARQTGGWWTAALVIKLTSDVWSRVQVAEHVDARVKTCSQHAHLIWSDCGDSL